MNTEITAKEIGSLSSENFLKLLRHSKNHAQINFFIHSRGFKDFSFFIHYFFPHYQEYPESIFLRNETTLFDPDAKGDWGCLCAPRGYAKSTFFALYQVVHAVVYGYKNYALIASDTQAQSHQKVKSIWTELVHNSRLHRVFGRFLNPKNSGAERLLCSNGKSETLIESVSARTEIRGKRHGIHRPDLIILDDYEHSTEVRNERIREKTEQNFKEVFLKLGSEKTTIVVVGTVLHKQSLLSNLLDEPHWNGRFYKAVIEWADRRDLWGEWREIYIDTDKHPDTKTRMEVAREFYEKNKEEMDKGTQVLWPERFSYYSLMEEYIKLGHRAFYKELQNEPIGDESGVFEHLYRFKEQWPILEIEHNGARIDGERLESFMAVDFSHGDKKETSTRKGDFTCVVAGLYDPRRRRLFVMEATLKREAPSKTIERIFEWHMDQEFTKIVLEANSMPLLRKVLMDTQKKRKVKLPFYLHEQTENKEARIEAIEPWVTNRRILFNETLPEELFQQFEDFPNAGHDDAPDAVELLWSSVTGRYQVQALNTRL